MEILPGVGYIGESIVKPWEVRHCYSRNNSFKDRLQVNSTTPKSLRFMFGEIPNLTPSDLLEVLPPHTREDFKVEKLHGNLQKKSKTFFWEPLTGPEEAV